MRYCLLLLSISACKLEKKAKQKSEIIIVDVSKIKRKSKINGLQNVYIVVKRKPKVSRLQAILMMCCMVFVFTIISIVTCAQCKLSYIVDKTTQYKDSSLNCKKDDFIKRKFRNSRCSYCNIICYATAPKAQSYIPEFEVAELKKTEKWHNKSIEQHEDSLYEYIYGESEITKQKRAAELQKPENMRQAQRIMSGGVFSISKELSESLEKIRNENKDKAKSELIKQKLAAELNNPKHLAKIAEEFEKQSKDLSAFEKKIIEINIKIKHNNELVQELLKSDLPLGLERKAQV